MAVLGMGPSQSLARLYGPVHGYSLQYCHSSLALLAEAVLGRLGIYAHWHPCHRAIPRIPGHKKTRRTGQVVLQHNERICIGM